MLHASGEDSRVTLASLSACSESRPFLVTQKRQAPNWVHSCRPDIDIRIVGSRLLLAAYFKRVLVGFVSG